MSRLLLLSTDPAIPSALSSIHLPAAFILRASRPLNSSDELVGAILDLFLDSFSTNSSILSVGTMITSRPSFTPEVTPSGAFSGAFLVTSIPSSGLVGFSIFFSPLMSAPQNGQYGKSYQSISASHTEHALYSSITLQCPLGLSLSASIAMSMASPLSDGNNVP